jgi:hypothetical protein
VVRVTLAGSESKRKQKASGSYADDSREIEVTFDQPRIPLSVDKVLG